LPCRVCKTLHIALLTCASWRFGLGGGEYLLKNVMPMLLSSCQACDAFNYAGKTATQVHSSTLRSERTADRAMCNGGNASGRTVLLKADCSDHESIDFDVPIRTWTDPRRSHCQQPARWCDSCRIYGHSGEQVCDALLEGHCEYESPSCEYQRSTAKTRRVRECQHHAGLSH
jgi:hypothetical protein